MLEALATVRRELVCVRPSKESSSATTHQRETVHLTPYPAMCCGINIITSVTYGKVISRQYRCILL